MKRLVSLVLAALMLTALIPTVVVQVYAEENDFNSGYIPDDEVRLIDDTYTGDGDSFSGYIPDDEKRLTGEDTDVVFGTVKMSPALINEILEPTEIMVDVWIFLESCIRSETEIERIISEKYTWENEQEHLKYYRKEVREITGAYVRQFIDDNADLLYKVKSYSCGAEFIVAEVSKENVPKLADLDTVSYMDLYVETIDVPAIEPDPTEPETINHTKELWERGAELTAEDIEEAANEQYNSRTYFFADKITVYNAYRFNCTPAYIVDFGVEGYGIYCEVITEEYFGDYLFYSASSYEPSIFVDDKLYTLTKAYRAGILTQEMLEELVEADYRGGDDYGPGSCKIITRNIKGDADGSGGVDVVDATYVQRYDVGIFGDDRIYKPLADVDGNREVDIIDATLIQRCDLGLYHIV